MKNKTIHTSFISALSLLALSQIMVGINIVSVKYIATSVPVFFILMVRFCLSTIFLFTLHRLIDAHQDCVLRYLKKMKKRDWMFIVAQALTAGVLFNVLMIIGLRYTSANMAGIITSTLPALIALMSWIFLREKFTTKKTICVGLATLGLLIISLTHSAASLDSGAYAGLGNLIILLAMIPETAYYVLTKMYVNTLPVFLISAIINGVNAIVIIPLGLWQTDWHHVSLTAMNGFILFIISLSSSLFFVFWYLGAAKVDAVMTSLSTAVMPVATVTLAWLFLNEVMTGSQLMGMILVMASIVVYAYRR